MEINPWKVIERGFDPEDDRAVMASESLFSLGNGAFGGRANFEEHYSGKSLKGHYVGGVYYPDKTRVGWWKNGYPEYFAKVLNSAFWIGLNVRLNGEELDLAKCEVEDFYRELDMREGVLRRRFKALLHNGLRVQIETERLISMAEYRLGALRYKITLLDGKSAAEVCLESYVNGNVRNEDANYDEKFWELAELNPSKKALTMRTKKTGFEVCWAQRCEIDRDSVQAACISEEESLKECCSLKLEPGESVTMTKYVGVTSSMNYAVTDLADVAVDVAEKALGEGFDTVLDAHRKAWAERWKGCDVVIRGDDSAQQGIRFCIFQLLQTYTGHDSRLNVGPKGFTGEKYGGSTYWDTEAYCLPFYLSTSGEEVARQLLVYRYNQLDKAIENAGKLGFTGGAALYPMVTMNGEECHNEWEITFEEIHRNGAIAYAIYHYCRYTGNREYLAEGGLEVLIGIARFWAQRATWSEAKKQYVILGVTGPNEYENNVNNNWYTNYLAGWCLRYAKECLTYVEVHHAKDYGRIRTKTGLGDSELLKWNEVAERLYLPEDKTLDVFLQQEGYLDKELRAADDLPAAERPINQHWSWDRILRSCFIKQADVLQGLYFFQEFFDEETIRRNFDFYEPKTVHESSLSPCVHSVLAAKTGRPEKAYELYLRASRLDLDDYNREVHEGLHITSMAGSWLSVVEGFGGIRIDRKGMLEVNPRLPESWKGLEFKIRYRGAILRFEIGRSGEVEVRSENGVKAEVIIQGSKCIID